ncbi:hypothetical protein LTS18_004781, partial [Coniosporium uncinatum]
PQGPQHTDTTADSNSNIYQERSTENGKIGLILVDNITSLLQPLIKSNYIQGHALLIPVLRSLSALTNQHNLCAILLNGVISPRQAPTLKEPILLPVAEQVSIFASNALRPALGKVVGNFVDVHLLVGALPRAKKDAEAVYDGRKVRGKVEMVEVVEVVQDRYGGRVGRWAGFGVRDGELEGVV